MRPLDALRALGPGSEPPPEAKQRVSAALFVALGAAATARAPLVKPRLPASVHPAQASLLGGIAGSKALTIAAGIWLMGGVTGAALYRLLRPIEVRVVYVERPTSPVPRSTPQAPEPSVAAAAAAESPQRSAPSSTARMSAERTGSNASQESGSDLARERALLDIARADAAHGEPAQALAVTEQHRTQFPQGRLSEEREALAIRALQSLERGAEARERALAFRTRYPNSFLIPALESALSSP